MCHEEYYFPLKVLLLVDKSQACFYMSSPQRDLTPKECGSLDK